MKADQQEQYWRNTNYRGPTHPVVKAYVEPKLDLIESVAPFAGRTVVDIGCGPGLFTHHLKQRGAEVIGTDRSDHMLAASMGIECVQADASDLPFADRSFEMAFEANLLHHVDDPAAVLAEMARVAKDTVVLIEVNALNPVMFGFSMVNPAERGGLKSFKGYLERLLREAHLEIVRFWTTGMISQNNTPAFLVPLLKIFDRDFPFGEYHVVVASKPSS